MIQQKIDNGRVSWRKALEDGVNGAISSALPRLGGTPSKSGNITSRTCTEFEVEITKWCAMAKLSVSFNCSTKLVREYRMRVIFTA